MLAAVALLFAFAGTGLAAPPAGYQSVYLTSLVDKTFAVVPKTPVNGSAIVVNKLDNKVDQQWYIKSGNVTGSIQLANTTLCIDAGVKSKHA
jgi:hypothetical protein